MFRKQPRGFCYLQAVPIYFRLIKRCFKALFVTIRNDHTNTDSAGVRAFDSPLMSRDNGTNSKRSFTGGP